MRLSWTVPAMAAALSAAACAPTTTGESFDDIVFELVNNGKLRKERAPADAPFTNADLVRNFDRIAFGLEAQFETPGGDHDLIRRWDGPVRWRIDRVSKPVEVETRLRAGQTFARLARATGIEIEATEDGSDTNFAILLLAPEDYSPLAARFSEMGLEKLAAWARGFRSYAASPCVGVFIPAPDKAGEGSNARGRIAYVLVLIREGLAEDLFLACLEEELSQGMGLPNDHNEARPSIFNDLQEFAFLTEHDEFLLRILYHPRLRPGMPRDEAMALVPGIVEELRPGGGTIE
ncbi:MAG: DUF2927 domain-containing protein [Pseudomonadota bacterium]